MIARPVYPIIVGEAVEICATLIGALRQRRRQLLDLYFCVVQLRAQNTDRFQQNYPAVVYHFSTFPFMRFRKPLALVPGIGRPLARLMR